MESQRQQQQPQDLPMDAAAGAASAAPDTGNNESNDNHSNSSCNDSVTLCGSVASTSRKRAHGDAELEVDVKCVMCATDQIKYRCPRCERITCSLACCLAHKKQYECNGKRDLTKYIEIKKFTDADLASDFFFLEEVARSANNAHRSRNQLGGNGRRYNAQQDASTSTPSKHKKLKKRQLVAMQQHINPHVSTDWLMRFPKSSQLFVREAQHKGVMVTLLAPGMSKRSRNTCYVDLAHKRLFWRIEWEFPHAVVEMKTLVEERASEDASLFSLLDKYLSPSIENVQLRAQLKAYLTGSTPWQQQIALLLRKEFCPGATEQFFVLDGTQPLGDVLKRKNIVEFPIIRVVLANQLDQFVIVHDVLEELSTEQAQVNGTDHGPLVKVIGQEDVVMESADAPPNGVPEAPDEPRKLDQVVSSTHSDELLQLEQRR